MACTPSERMGLPSRSFAADAHDCIMVWIRMESTEYKGVARYFAPNGELPSDSSPRSLGLRRGTIGKSTAGGYVDDRRCRPAALFPASRASSKSGKCSPSPTYPPAPTNQKN